MPQGPAQWRGGRWEYGSAPTPAQPIGRRKALAPAQPKPMEVQTSIQPEGVFPSRFTQQAGNLASALAMPGRADLYAGSQMGGVSAYSPMTQWGVGTDYARGLAQSMIAGPQMATQHALANARTILSQQAAREQEAQGWAGVGLQNLGVGQMQQGNLLSFLASIYRPMMG